MNEITKPATQLDFELQNQKFTIEYPKSGQMIDIAVLKSKISEGEYTQLILQRSDEATIGLKLIDAYCFLTIMLPELKTKLNVKSLYDLELIDSIELIHVYNSVIIPWLDSWTLAVNAKIEELNGSKNNAKRNIV